MSLRRCPEYWDTAPWHSCWPSRLFCNVAAPLIVILEFGKHDDVQLYA